MHLRQKVYSLFNVIIPTGTSDAVALKELGRRGKFDLAKAMHIIFMLMVEVEQLQEKLDELTVKPTKK